MYEGKILGKKISITNKQYKSLEKRWNQDNLKKTFIGWKVQGLCILCSDAGEGTEICDGCQLFVLTSLFLGSPIQGCMRVIKETIGKYGYSTMIVTDSFIFFDVKEETAKGYMRKMQKVLSTFKKA